MEDHIKNIKSNLEPSTQVTKCCNLLELNGWKIAGQSSHSTRFINKAYSDCTIDIFYGGIDGIRLYLGREPFVETPINYFALVGAFAQAKLNLRLLGDEVVAIDDELPF